MNNDVGIRIGRDHLFCEDFGRYSRLLHADVPSGTPYVVLADGCSDPLSPDTNIGAMLLSLAAENQLFLHDSPDELHQAVMTTADYYRTSMKLHPQCLDATLLTARIIKSENKRFIRATAYGDGIIAAKRKDGSIRVYNVVFESGRPYYLNYNLDPSRKSKMVELFGGNPNVVHDWMIAADGTALHMQADGLNIKSENPLVVKHFPIEEYDFVAIMTDGVHRVVRVNEDGSEVIMPFTEAIERLMNFGAARAGVFVQRRMNLFERHCRQNKFQFFDDLSVGVIYCA